MSLIVSIIIPNFNKAKFVRETLRSLKAQTYSNFEVIVVDDASTDYSVKVIEDEIKDDFRFRLIKQSVGCGGSAARNIGFSEAKGEYIIFFDSDDLLDANCLQNRIEIFRDSTMEKYDFLIFPMGCFKQLIGDLSEKWMPKAYSNHLLKFLSHQIPWQTMQPIWKREFLQNLKTNEFLGPFDEEYPRLQDVEMHTRALLAGGKYKIIEGAVPDCYYRIDLQRTDASRENQLSRQIQGFCQYLTKIGKLVSTRGRRYRAALRLSYFEALVTLCYWSNKREVSEEFEKEKLNELSVVAMSSNLLSAYHRLIIRLYVSLLRGRIKGINWLIRKLLMAF